MSPDKFTQGYVSALRQSHPEIGDAPLSDQAIIQISEDCEEFGPYGSQLHLRPPEYGEAFFLARQSKFDGWTVDQSDFIRRFPPIWPWLHDGEIHLSPVSEH
jgi:hypothetical protein